MDKLHQLIELIRVKMQGLWGAIILSLLLLTYGLSSLPGQTLVAAVAILPLVIAWRALLQAQQAKLRQEDNLLRSEKADLQSAKAMLEAEQTGLKEQITTLKTGLKEQITTLELERMTINSQLVELLSIVSDGVFITNAEDKIVYANSSLEQLINKPAAEIVAHSLHTFIKNKGMAQAIAQAAAAQTGQTIQLTGASLYKSVSTASLRSVWVKDKPEGVVLALHPDEPLDYQHRNSPGPRPRSTASLGDVFGWFFPSASFQPAEPYINQVAHKSRNDPRYAGRYGLAGSAEPETGSTLYSLVRLMRPKNVIEIGSYIGTSSICIAQALVDNGDSGMLNCIEAENNHIALAIDHLREAALEHKVIFHHGCSDDPGIIHALPRSQLIFIDGDHTYEGAKKDFEIYSKLLTDEGVIVYHDTIKIMALQRLMNEIAQNPSYDIFTFATSDGDGVTLIRKGLDK